MNTISELKRELDTRMNEQFKLLRIADMNKEQLHRMYELGERISFIINQLDNTNPDWNDNDQE